MAMKANKVFTTILILIGSLVVVSCKSDNSSEESRFLLKISVENPGDFSGKGWSEIKEIDDKKVRIMHNNEANFTVPAWWGNSARPKEGEIFVMEIDYQDVFTGPFVVSSFGNCENAVQFISKGEKAAYEFRGGKEIVNGLSELHRIVGENDLEWKTAMIPVSWDYLYAGEGNPAGFGKQEFSIKLMNNNDKNLPISAIRIRKATKNDEEQYNAEMRTWIKKNQQKYYANREDNILDAELPNSWKSKNCIPYLRNYLSPILPYDIPEKEEIGSTINVRMATNEIECKQLGVFANGRDIQRVSISLSDMKNEKGELFEGEIKLHTVEYAFVKKEDGSLTIDAQRIWPLYEADIKNGNSQAFWLTFETDSLVNSGLYKGGIDILIKGKRVVKVPLEIEVMPIRLLTMEAAALSMGGCVTGLVPFHNISYAVKNNVNATNLWFASVRPAMGKIDGKLVLDFTLLDEWMKEAKRLGWQNIVYFLGGNPYGFPRTMNLERELFVVMQDEGTREEREEKFLKLAAEESNRGHIIKEIRDVYSQWIEDVTKHAHENGWPELILTPFDEPAKAVQKPYRKEGYEKDDLVIGTGPWIRSHFIDACQLIRKSAPHTRIYGSIHHASGIEYLPYIDVFCTNAIHEDLLLGDKVRADGKDKYFWQYTGVGAGSEPARMRYSFGFYFGAFDSRGSLLWAYNWGNRFDTTEGDNWMICWDTPFGTIPTLSYEGLREAWDDRRYIETLKRIAAMKDKEEEVQMFLKRIFDEASHSRKKGGEDTVNDFWNETNDLQKLDEWRYSIADKIIEISGLEERK